MAENIDDLGLGYLMGETESLTGESAIPSTSSPEKLIKDYDNEQEQSPISFDQLLSSVQTPKADPALDAYARGLGAAQMQADQYAGSDRLRLGSAPQQEIMDPGALISSPGQRVERGLKAGLGDLSVGTGDAFNYIGALLFPKETDGTTQVGEYFKRIGTELQQENLLVLSDDLQDMTWDDLFKGEFWSSKASRLLPYAASFIIPYTAGAKLSNVILKGMFRVGQPLLRGLQSSGVIGTMDKGVKLAKAGEKGLKGSGALRYLGVDAGKKGITPTKLMRNVTGYLGGGVTANVAEGAYLAGEAYQEMINEIDPETGQPMFTPAEAAEHASGVVFDNAKFFYVDAFQYAVLFGGAGRGLMGKVLRAPITKSSIKDNSRGVVSALIRRAAPSLPAVGAYASIEGVTEGFQEVYQEWAKYKNIQEAKGKDYDEMTTWLKEAPFGKDRPELRDIFWSSVGLGGAMGGMRGAFDSIAERQALIDKKVDQYNNAIDIIREAAADQTVDQKLAMDNAVDNLLASNIWNYSGDGSVAMSIVDNLVKDGKITEEQGLEYKTKIEQAEANYEAHHVNSTLTEAGAESAFYAEMRKSRKEGEIADEIEQHEQRKEKAKKIIKSDKTKLQKKLDQLEAEHQATMTRLQNELQTEEQVIENIYTAEMDKAPTAKSTGKRDARFKEKGLTRDEFETFTQEGEKQRETREAAEAEAKAEEEAAKPSPTIRERITEAGTKAFQAAKDVGAAAVKGVRGVVGKVRKPAVQEETQATEEKVKKTVEDINKLTDKQITPTAKEKLVKAVEDGEITPEAALEIKGTGRGGTINTRDVNSAIRKSKKAKPETSQEDVKKKDQPRVVPKSKDYKKTEEELEGDGIKTFAASISKVQGKDAGAFSYFVKSKDRIIKFFADRKVDILKYTREPENITLRLVKPEKGQSNVVEIDGKNYFRYTKDGPLYESKIEVVAGDVVLGEVEQAAQEFYQETAPTTKAKKKDQRKIDQIVKGVRDTKEKIIKYFTRSQKELDGYTPTQLDIRPAYRYGSGVIAASIVRDVVNKKFPGAKGVLVYNKLIDDYGQEASSLAIGSTVFINIDSVAQTDIIHEAGHIYYGLMEDTPLMKRIIKLLPKSALFTKTKQDYPELIIMNYKGKKITLGELYRNIVNNTDSQAESDLISIANNLSQAIKEGDNARINDLFISLRTQLKAAGAKDVRDSQQKHLLEETFTRTLEAYSYGTVDAVIEGSAAQKRLENDLISFYKEVKNLTNDDDARQILNLTVKDIASLDLENATKAVLLNFKSDKGTLPKMKNSAYGPIGRASKKQRVKNSSYSAVSFYISEYIGDNRTADEVADLVMQAIADDSNLSVQEQDIQKLKNGIKAVILQRTRPNDLKKADNVLDKELEAIGINLKEKEDIQGESEVPNDINLIEEKDVGLPTTTSLFIRKIVEVHNSAVEEEGRIDAKQVLAAMMSLAKETKENPLDFADEVRESGNPALSAVVNVLDRVYANDKVLTNAKLVELKGPLEGITIETLAHNVLTIKNDTERYWSRYVSTSATIEKRVIDGIVNSIKENKTVSDEVSRIFNTLFSKAKPFSDKQKYDAAKGIFNAILAADGSGVMIDVDAMLNETMIYKGKRQSVPNILFDEIRNKQGFLVLKNQFMVRRVSKKLGYSDVINKSKVLGTFHGKQTDIRTILLHGLIMSRGMNYLSMVDNVDMDGVSIFNKENGLHNRGDNVDNLFKEGVELDKNDIIHQDNNIFGQMALKNSDKKGKTFHFTVHSGLMRRFIDKAYGLRNVNSRTKKLTDANPNELIASDFFMFLNRYNDGIKNKEQVIRYDQPIAVFSDKSRRYYVESIAAHNAKTRKALLSRIEKNPAYKAKYKGYAKALKKLNERIKEEKINAKTAAQLRKRLETEYRVFPYDIENGKIKQMPEMIKRWQNYANENKELFENNNALQQAIDPKTRKVNPVIIGNFLTSYIANRFMAQQMFVHDHRQSKNQIDYIKRAAGAIASHTVFDRNTTVEFVVTKDYYETKDGDIYTAEDAKKILGDTWEKDVAIENDAMGYVLPEEAETIRARYGASQNVGNVFKFVYHYTQLEGPQKGRTTYMKFAVHTLTPELEALSPYLKSIGDVLRTRRDQVRANDNKGGLVIAASESSAKLYSGGDRVIHDISEGFDMDNIMTIQDEIYKGDGKYVGLSGEGFGIQLELDKQTDERFFPSQLFYNLATNTAPEDQATVNTMLEQRQEVMEANNKERNEDEGLIMNDQATEEDVIRERNSFKSSVSADIFDVLVDNTYDNLDPRYPYLNAVHNSIATGRITHKGTKMYTKGSIAYQSASLGMGLRFYETGLYTGQPIQGIKNKDIVASEAIIPGYMQDKGVKVGDLFIGTRVPAHGKVSSAVFIVKGFHKKIGTTPTSNITIPSWVSKYWGADLDGDSIHMNFKYTPEEVSKKSWRKLSNDFLDSYIKLVSKSDKEGEVQADIDFKTDAENAIAKVFKDKDMASQLEPMGDAQMFEDNVPAKHQVGMIASLMRSFNVFSNSQDPLPFEITIKGESGAITHDKFYDDAKAENGIGNWYGVAQLLNIALDNAKHQYASKLGMNMQSVFSYVLLRRLGYSLNDLAVLFNSPIVKKYMEYKSNNSAEYISKDSDIKDMFINKDGLPENKLLKFAKDNGLGRIDLKAFANKGSVSIDLSKLKNKTEQQKAVLMLYSLDKFKKHAVDPISKAFTVHQSIEKNPLELFKIRQGIKEAQGVVRIPLIGQTGFTYTFTENTKNNFIINHATKLFDSILERAERTDVRFTPYMKRILSIPASIDKLSGLGEIQQEVINQVIVNDLKNRMKTLKLKRSEADIIKLFEDLKQRESENSFIKNVVEIGERQEQKYIVMNRAAITQFTSYKAIEQYKESFAELSEADQDLMFEIEYAFNRFGLTGGAGKASSFVPFFSNEYIEKINNDMSTIVEENQTKQPDYSRGPVPQELITAIKDVKDRKDGYKKLNTRQQIKAKGAENNTILVKPKKVIAADVSYNNDHLGGDVETLSFLDFVKDKGIDIDKIDRDSETFVDLQDQYTAYLSHLELVREFKQGLKKKPLNSYTIQGLLDLHKDLDGMHAAATKGVRYEIEKTIGQKAFDDQSKYLRDVGASKGYTYNIPGVDGTPQQDLGNFQAWLGSNDMTSNRPEIQYLINEAQKQYRKYLASFREHKNIIEAKNRSLVRSKTKALTLLERISGAFDTQARYRYIYGNIATVEDGRIRLFTPQEIVSRGVELTKEEQDYYETYKALAEILLGAQNGRMTVPSMQLGTVENMTRSGLFGLYSTAIDSQDYYRVRVRGKGRDGKDTIKTFYEWKYDVYKGRTGKLTLDSGKEIYELDKLRRKAKQLKAKGKHEDGKKIILSDMEYDALVNDGQMMRRLVGSKNITDFDAELIQEYERRKGVKAQNINYDIHNSMLEFMRGHIFYNGDGQYKLEDGSLVEREDRFTGMGELSVLTDAIIGFNKNLDNKNAVKYLTGWWKEGFLGRKQQDSVMGKTGDKVIDGFVKLTSLRLLGFNMTVGIGNLLAGKYQELRKRGGKQFILGESRYWRDFSKSQEILQDKRLIELSFDEFVHLNEQKGLAGKVEKWAYLFMDKTENYIQGASFLGMLTEQEFNNPDTITEERVMQINNKISTLHGEGYTALDASLLSMYSYGRALLQFKKWFVTLFKDRFRAEDIDRFGNVNIGSYRASSEFVVDLFRKYFAGGITKQEIIDIYNKSSDQRKSEMRAHATGVGLGITVLSLIAIMEDDDEPDNGTIRTLKKLSSDIFVTVDGRRFVNYTIVPAAYGTAKNVTRMVGEAVSGEETQRKSELADRGSSKALKTLQYDILPYAEVRKKFLRLQED